MHIEKIITDNKTIPIGRAIEPVTTALSKHSVFTPMVGSAPGPNGGKMSLLVGKDNEGNTWAYAYTSLLELNKAIKQGGTYAEMQFSQLFSILEANQHLRGLYINSASESFFPIPRELFPRMKTIMTNPALQGTR